MGVLLCLAVASCHLGVGLILAPMYILGGWTAALTDILIETAILIVAPFGSFVYYLRNPGPLPPAVNSPLEPLTNHFGISKRFIHRAVNFHNRYVIPFLNTGRIASPQAPVDVSSLRSEIAETEPSKFMRLFGQK
jgi:hypothetical protein